MLGKLTAGYNRANDYLLNNSKRINLLLSLVIAIFATLIFYPGVFFSDSYGRWQYAHLLLNGESWGIYSWLSLIPSVFMAMVYKLTGNVAVFTFLQSFLFLYTSILMVTTFFRKYAVVLLIALLVNPIFICYSVFADMSIGTLIGLNIALYTLLHGEHFGNIKLALLTFISFLVAFGFRQITVTVLPLLLGIIMYQFFKNNRKKAIIKLVAAIFAILTVAAAPYVLNVHALNSSSAGFMWEILSTINRLPEEKREKYATFLDDVPGVGEGVTEVALEENRQNNRSVNSFLWSSVDATPLGSAQANQMLVQRYLQLATKEPGTLLKNKVSIIMDTMGLPHPIESLMYEYNTWDVMSEYGMVDSNVRHFLINSFNSFMYITIIFRLPWLWFLLAAGYVVFLCKRKQLTLPTGAMFGVAVLYYGAFFLTTQSFEFRYFFPSFFYLYILTISGCCTMLKLLVNKTGKQISLEKEGLMR